MATSAEDQGALRDLRQPPRACVRRWADAGWVEVLREWGGDEVPFPLLRAGVIDFLAPRGTAYHYSQRGQLDDSHVKLHRPMTGDKAT